MNNQALYSNRPQNYTFTHPTDRSAYLEGKAVGQKGLVTVHGRMGGRFLDPFDATWVEFLERAAALGFTARDSFRQTQLDAFGHKDRHAIDLVQTNWEAFLLQADGILEAVRARAGLTTWPIDTQMTLPVYRRFCKARRGVFLSPDRHDARYLHARIVLEDESQFLVARDALYDEALARKLRIVTG